MRISLRSLACLLAMMMAPAATPTHGWIVRMDGIGPVKIGMTLPQLSRTLHERFSLPESRGDQGCFYVSPKRLSGVAFTIEDKRFVRVDISAPGIFTPEGIQVGDSKSEVLRAYHRKVKIEPGAYAGEYLTVQSSDGRYGIRFEADKNKIAQYYAGRFSAVQYVEGCE